SPASARAMGSGRSWGSWSRRSSASPRFSATSAGGEDAVPNAADIIGYMRTVGRGSPVDRPWSLARMIVSMLRHGRGNAPKDSPLTLQDVMASEDYRDLMTAKVRQGELAPDFELPLIDGNGHVRLSSLAEERPVALVFG